MLAGTRTAPPERKKSRQAWRPPRTRLKRWLASVRTASVLTTGLVQSEKNRANSRWRPWLRSSSEISAPVSSRSSPATPNRLQQVVAVARGEIGDPGFERAEQTAHSVRRASGTGGRETEIVGERQTHDFRGLALAARRRFSQGAAQFAGQTDGELFVHGRPPTAL